MQCGRSVAARPTDLPLGETAHPEPKVQGTMGVLYRPWVSGPNSRTYHPHRRGGRALHPYIQFSFVLCTKALCTKLNSNDALCSTLSILAQTLLHFHAQSTRAELFHSLGRFCAPAAMGEAEGKLLDHSPVLELCNLQVSVCQSCLHKALETSRTFRNGCHKNGFLPCSNSRQVSDQPQSPKVHVGPARDSHNSFTLHRVSWLGAHHMCPSPGP